MPQLDGLRAVAVAFVIPAPGAPDDLGEQIMQACAGRLAGFKCPKAVYLVDEFPRATLEKVAKNKLAAQLSYDFQDQVYLGELRRRHFVWLRMKRTF